MIWVESFVTTVISTICAIILDMLIPVKFTSMHLNIKDSSTFKDFISKGGKPTTVLLQAILMDYMLRLSLNDRRKKYSQEDLEVYEKTYGTTALSDSIVYKDLMKYIDSKTFARKHKDNIEEIVNSVVIPTLACGVIGSLTQEFSLENEQLPSKILA